jgi:hypothetical protein
VTPKAKKGFGGLKPIKKKRKGKSIIDEYNIY